MEGLGPLRDDLGLEVTYEDLEERELIEMGREGGREKERR